MTHCMLLLIMSLVRLCGCPASTAEPQLVPASRGSMPQRLPRFRHFHRWCMWLALMNRLSTIVEPRADAALFSTFSFEGGA